MRSDPAATSPDDDSSAPPNPVNGAKPRPRIVPIEGSDAMSMFQSEEALASRGRNPFADMAKRFTLPPLATQLSGRNLWLALLALIVVTQAGFIAFWMLSNRPAAAPLDGGAVTITSEPSGSPVTIDGTSRGVTPLNVTLAAGAHRVDVGGSGQVRTQTLNVTRGVDASIHVALAAAAAANAAATGIGGLRIVTEPPGARVWIDGQLLGTAPMTVSDLKIGDHAVTVRGRSGDAVNRTVKVEEATMGSLIISLGSSAGFASGWLAIASEVPLQIRENGTVLGSTDAPRILLPVGTHQLELANPSLDYVVTRSVQIEGGQTTTVGLKAPMGKISINAIPWAEVWIDGQRAGETPIGNLSVAIGNHELLFRHPELGERRRNVSIGAVAPQRVGVDMNKP